MAFFGSELPFPFDINLGSGTLALLDDLEGPLATRQQCRSSGLSARLRHGSGPRVDRRPTDRRTCPDGDLRLRTHAHAEGSAEGRGGVFHSLPAVPGGIHGLRRRRMCGLRGAGAIDGQRQMKRVCVDGPVFDGAVVAA